MRVCTRGRETWLIGHWELADAQSQNKGVPGPALRHLGFA